MTEVFFEVFFKKVFRSRCIDFLLASVLKVSIVYAI